MKYENSLDKDTKIDSTSLYPVDEGDANLPKLEFDGVELFQDLNIDIYRSLTEDDELIICAQLDLRYDNYDHDVLWIEGVKPTLEFYEFINKEIHTLNENDIYEALLDTETFVFMTYMKFIEKFNYIVKVNDKDLNKIVRKALEHKA